MVRIIGSAIILLVALALANLISALIHKPTELFAFIGHRLDKEPAETWRSYGPLFRTYSTNTIPPELLAALAQIESSGNPVDRTYWRWRWSLNPFAIYQPASSAVGLFQMIDGAYAEAAKFCIRDHAVTDSGCGFPSFYVRTIPRIDLSRPQCRGRSRPRRQREGKCEREAGSRGLHPSLRRRSRDCFRAPSFPDEGR